MPQRDGKKLTTDTRAGGMQRGADRGKRLNSASTSYFPRLFMDAALRDGAGQNPKRGNGKIRRLKFSMFSAAQPMIQASSRVRRRSLLSRLENKAVAGCLYSYFPHGSVRNRY